MNIKLNYDDICIIPEVSTSIKSRKECNCYDENGMLPIFTAPMDTVIGVENINTFIENKINPVIPRTVSIADRECFFWFWKRYWNTPVFVSFSLKEAQTMLIRDGKKVTGMVNEDCRHFLCIDMANGHMQELIDTVKEIKRLYGNEVVVMTGNIANPETYRLYEEAGVDYCRAGIGGGSCCVVEGTEVTMADGSKENIEDINVGDVVKTMDGNKKVINTFSKEVRSTIIINGSIETTPDHEFFVLKKSDVNSNMSDEDIKSKGFYVRADNLTDEYVLVED